MSNQNIKGEPPSLPEYKHIPHYDIKNAYQSITYRLADSLPTRVLNELSKELDKMEKLSGEMNDSSFHGEIDNSLFHGEVGSSSFHGEMGGSPIKKNKQKLEAQRRQKIEQYLDAGHGCCILKKPEIAQIIIDNWQFFDGQRYDLIAYVVMPNHVHVLIKSHDKWPLRKVLHSWKSYTAKEIKEILLKTGEPPVLPESIWQADYWDRFIRNDNHFLRTIDYIHDNPVKAGLCQSTQDWHASSFTWERGLPAREQGRAALAPRDTQR